MLCAVEVWEVRLHGQSPERQWSETLFPLCPCETTSPPNARFTWETPYWMIRGGVYCGRKQVQVSRGPQPRSMQTGSGRAAYLHGCAPIHTHSVLSFQYSDDWVLLRRGGDGGSHLWHLCEDQSSEPRTHMNAGWVVYHPPCSSSPWEDRNSRRSRNPASHGGQLNQVRDPASIHKVERNLWSPHVHTPIDAHANVLHTH